MNEKVFISNNPSAQNVAKPVQEYVAGAINELSRQLQSAKTENRRMKLKARISAWNEIKTAYEEAIKNVEEKIGKAEGNEETNSNEPSGTTTS